MRANGQPLLVPVSTLDEDTANPRTEFPDAELDELAADIRERGILQSIVVEPHGEGLAVRYRVRLGARRLRAAIRAGLIEVPVTIASRPLDAYAQVAENLKRDGLSPLDLARFIRSRVDAGESNATVAKKLSLDQTTVAHHLTLLTLPPVLDEALKSGRCTSPRTLHELSKLHEQSPSKVETLLKRPRRCHARGPCRDQDDELTDGRQGPGREARYGHHAHRPGKPRLRSPGGDPPPSDESRARRGPGSPCAPSQAPSRSGHPLRQKGRTVRP